LSLNYHNKKMKVFQRIKEKKQQLLRLLFGSFSATALMFTFQACYGMPQSYVESTIRGTVTDAETGEAIGGLSVASEYCGFSAITDQDGNFEDSTGVQTLDEWGRYPIQVTDIDSTENGLYETLDTVISAIDLQNPIHLKVKRKSENS
jgi:hypothetical protein